MVWKDRIFKNPRQRILKDMETGEIKTFEIQDDPDNIEIEGTPVNAENLNNSIGANAVQSDEIRNLVFLENFEKYKEIKNKNELVANTEYHISGDNSRDNDGNNPRLIYVDKNKKENIVSGSCKKILFDGDINADGRTIALGKNVKDFDLLIVVTRSDTASATLFRLQTITIPTDIITDTGGTSFYIPQGAPSNGAGSARITVKPTEIVTESGFGTYTALKRVYGIKF